ncbi:hypothetical protein OROHE_019693 [Orobanche hederae]
MQNSSAESVAAGSTPVAKDVEAPSASPQNPLVLFSEKPNFWQLKANKISGEQIQCFRKIPVPPHRYTPLKKAWLEICTSIRDDMRIDIRMNLKALRVELSTRSGTPDASRLQRCADCVHAFMLGFDAVDVVAMLWMDWLCIESFEMRKMLRRDHLSRAIGRLGRHGRKLKFAIGNLTRTRIVIEHSKMHVLGSPAEKLPGNVL